MSFTVQLLPVGVTLKVNPGTPFVDMLHEYGVEFPCGGAGICGRCKVRLVKGCVHVSGQHAEALRKNGLDSRWRLACMSAVTDNLSRQTLVAAIGKNGGRFLRYAHSCLVRSGRNDGRGRRSDARCTERAVRGGTRCAWRRTPCVSTGGWGMEYNLYN
ncbi:MAG: 2Fe-2S iron-sulfur cluster binding domain-containing protein [Prevotellaceae bacterium]|jgi:ferredoxin|nr:2Fe-2S iron-sulfur cluster binding domain-containing protein [Prevotellaceae bacterium]